MFVFVLAGGTFLVLWSAVNAVATAIELNGDEAHDAKALQPKMLKKAGVSATTVEFLFFMGYVVTMTLAFVRFDNDAMAPYSTASALEDQFTGNEWAYNLNFGTLKTRADVVNWLDLVLVPNALPTAAASGDALSERQLLQLGDYTSYRVGRVRLRTIRVKGSRRPLKELRGDAAGIGKAYPQYSSPWRCNSGASSSESTADFAPLDSAPLVVAYVSPQASKSPSYYSTTTRETFCGGGQTFLLADDYQGAKSEIAQLCKAGWFIGAGVRAFVTEFVTYNPNTDMFSLFRAVVEVEPTGTLIPTYQITTVPLATASRCVNAFARGGKGQTTNQMSYVAIELLLYLQVTAVLLLEVYRLRCIGRKYFGSLWRVASLLSVAATAAVLVCHIQNAFWASNLDLSDYGDAFPGMIASKIVSYKHVDEIAAVATILLYLKLFKYLRAYRALAQFWDTVQQCVDEVKPICVILFVILIAFASAWSFAFGSELEDFRDPATSLRSLWRAMVGDFDSTMLVGPQRQTTNGTTGVVLFVGFVVSIVFVVLSLFLSVIDRAYDDVRENLDAGFTISNEDERFTAEIYACLMSPIHATDALIHKLIRWSSGVDVDFDRVRQRRRAPDRAFHAVLEFQRTHNHGIVGRLHEARGARGKLEEDRTPPVSPATPLAEETFDAATDVDVVADEACRVFRDAIRRVEGFADFAFAPPIAATS